MNEAANRNSRKMNRAIGAVTPAEKAAIEIRDKPFEQRSTPMELSPEVFTHRTGFDPDEDSHDPVLDNARGAYTEYSKTLGELFRREAVIREDKTKTPEAQALDVDALAGKAIEAVGKKNQSKRDAVVLAISDIDSEISRSLKSRLSEGEAREIRDYVRSLPSKAKRREFLKTADTDVVAAILSGKPFLSGLGDAEINSIRHEAVNNLFPEQVKRRKKLEAAQKEIDAGWSRFMGEAMKLQTREASAMREWQERSHQAVKAAFE